MDSNALLKEHVEILLDGGLMRMHIFSDGRRLMVMRAGAPERYRYFWRLKNGSIIHDDSIGYPGIGDCTVTAQALFGNSEWNRFDGERIKT